ncbi:hypothetical protein SARC_14884 [Sphaeroforma arctica JP610]|uniref:Uncharacterized protein n=1 Tax=Sphaeroforma arctica JP610 TaxID=667725 RepID=A0A0L0F8W4_9EUKA|nr:hypothetical protein SARC_14884 [Sphaeroforma arctica JP610]KNC72558.1 hypothetical protein SARC_14884 [Sphaeroforma arctica JP610]|eukprot:XP_014146460.1 hypothetical protein SARC_14884 [Sphaeroforma arctica JP610]
MKRRQYDAGGRALKKIAGTNRHLVRRSPVVCPFYRLNTIKYLHPNANISTWSLQDILAGDIRRLLVFNFMVDVQFLLREVPR